MLGQNLGHTRLFVNSAVRYSVLTLVRKLTTSLVVIIVCLSVRTLKTLTSRSELYILDLDQRDLWLSSDLRGKDCLFSFSDCVFQFGQVLLSQVIIDSFSCLFPEFLFG